MRGVDGRLIWVMCRTLCKHRARFLNAIWPGAVRTGYLSRTLLGAELSRVMDESRIDPADLAQLRRPRVNGSSLVSLAGVLRHAEVSPPRAVLYCTKP